MLATVAKRLASVIRSSFAAQVRLPTLVTGRLAHSVAETGEELNERYIEIFQRTDIDGWEIRQAMNDLMGMDLVVEPEVIIAGLHACRAVNDIALAIRWVEACKEKCGNQTKVLYPYLLKEITPTLKELGVPTLEELKYDKPELALKSVYDM